MTANQEVIKPISTQVNELDIYPNPTNGTITLTAPNGAEICLYDALGRMVFKENIADNSAHHPVNIQALPNGVYWCIVRLNFESISGGLIIKQ
jgi:hypothetical protein